MLNLIKVKKALRKDVKRMYFKLGYDIITNDYIKLVNHRREWENE